MAYAPNPEIFVKAADHIARNGFHQGFYLPIDTDFMGTLYFDDVPMDLSGAINYVANGNPVPQMRYNDSVADKAIRWAEDYADEWDLIDREMSIPAWSDREGRTQEEAIALLMRLAEGARGVEA